MFRTTKLLGVFFAIVLGGLVSAAAGCGDEESVGDSGNGKGPEMISTMENGRPGSPSATNMSQTTPQPGIIPEPPGVTACRPDATCLGDFGCQGICIDGVITACQTCVNGAFTSCSERACQ